MGKIEIEIERNKTEIQKIKNKNNREILRERTRLINTHPSFPTYHIVSF